MNVEKKIFFSSFKTPVRLGAFKLLLTGLVSQSTVWRTNRRNSDRVSRTNRLVEASVKSQRLSKGIRGCGGETAGGNSRSYVPRPGIWAPRRPWVSSLFCLRAVCLGSHQRCQISQN